MAAIDGKDGPRITQIEVKYSSDVKMDGLIRRLRVRLATMHCLWANFRISTFPLLDMKRLFVTRYVLKVMLCFLCDKIFIDATGARD